MSNQYVLHVCFSSVCGLKTVDMGCQWVGPSELVFQRTRDTSSDVLYAGFVFYLNAMLLYNIIPFMDAKGVLRLLATSGCGDQQTPTRCTCIVGLIIHRKHQRPEMMRYTYRPNH